MTKGTAEEPEVSRSNEGNKSKLEEDALNIDANQLILKITFSKSHSKYFKDAVQIARELPNYKISGEENEQTHRVKVQLSLDDLQLWERVRTLALIVRNWKKSKIEIIGIPVRDFMELERGISEVRNCYKRWSESGIGEMYCSGKDAPDDETSCFGCRLVKGVTLLGKHSYSFTNLKWYQFGMLSDDLMTFKVEKNEILRICKLRTDDHLCTTCPRFSWGRVRKDISELPDTIILDESSPFEVKYSEIDPSKHLGIQPRGWSTRSAYPLHLGDHREDKGEDTTQRNIPSIQYSDVAGQDAALAEIKNVVQLPLMQPEYFEEIGVDPPNSLILYGPPGNGKTLIAKAVATESKAHLEIISGPEGLSKWVGQSEENLRSVFRRAKELEPSVILIDEIDAIAPNRDTNMQQHDVRLVSQLLVLLDGLEARGRVVVIATTNRIEAVDPAIRRPGRFDYHIEVPLPDCKGREAILETYFRNMKTAPKVDINAIAESTEGFSGAELAALSRETGLVAINRGLDDGIDLQHLMIIQKDVKIALESIRLKRVTVLLD